MSTARTRMKSERALTRAYTGSWTWLVNAKVFSCKSDFSFRCRSRSKLYERTSPTSKPNFSARNLSFSGTWASYDTGRQCLRTSTDNPARVLLERLRHRGPSPSWSRRPPTCPLRRPKTKMRTRA